MPTPDSGPISFNDLNAALGKSSSTTISLASASLGYYTSINVNSIDRPDGSAPYSMTEWYGYNENAIATTIFNISSATAIDLNEACALVIDSVLYHNGLNASPDIGDYVFLDSEGESPFNGGQSYYKIDGNLLLGIDNTGEILAKEGCRG